MTLPESNKILVADDDPAIRYAVVRLLTSAGYQTLEASNGALALELMQRDQPTLTVMDLQMPELGGMRALDLLRQRGSRLSVIILSASGDIESRVEGLGLGADDYVTKPFDSRELLARVAAVLRRRCTCRDVRSRKLRSGDVLIDLDAKVAERAGERLTLTPTEYRILEMLAGEPGLPVSRCKLLEAVWGYSSVTNTRTLETHVWRLRKKLGDKRSEATWIANRQGFGYVLLVPIS